MGDGAGIPLGRSVIDRAAHHRGDPAWLTAAWARGRVVVVDTAAGVTLVDAAGALVLRDPAGVSLDAAEALLDAAAADPALVDPAARGAYFLGVDGDGTPYFAVDAPLAAGPGQRLAGLRDLADRLPARDADLLVTALGVAHWHARHGHSAATGSPTRVRDGGWTRVDAAGAQSWPRTDPAVIMLVHDGGPGPGGRCLLAVNASWDDAAVKRFSCLAGFVEPGESAESAVAREVAEEVGVPVGPITYVGSQPWPYPSSLMLGFLALADPAVPVREDPAEIALARWFTRAEVAAIRAGEERRLPGGARIAVTSNASISASLIDHWLAS
ncbi:putative NADH pyrophosphatase/NUDIX hydrolase [Pilimelia anulata]|uniref:NAD(+) diphosphatase n=1 Tax=Pilimelia anulata TaxID=53371 RepID=A0A8J3B7V5_9ACTN|nr:NAD(+) diphosphatase [Pilimelia anulata]GGK00792.1 putative NADH pyrophosphatase/NUDIX hydrolase [Pilimelia anulata]